MPPTRHVPVTVTSPGADTVGRMHYFVAARSVVAIRPGVRAGRLADVTDLVPDGPHHAVALDALDVTVCGRDVDRPLNRFLDRDFEHVDPQARCPDCHGALAQSA
jgi:hypothetical protein